MNTASNLPAISFESITEALRNIKLPPSDLVIGIGSGGVVFAAMAAYELETPLRIIWLNYRGFDNTPIHPTPQISQTFSLPQGTKNVLLVDDVVVSGKTLEAAKKLLPKAKVTTMVLKGNADIVLFPDIQSCVQWPWNPIK